MKFFKSSKIDVATDFTIETIDNIPYVNGKFYVVVSSSQGTFKSPVSDVNQHQVVLNFNTQHMLQCKIQTSGMVVEPEYIKCKIYHLTPNKTIKLGKIHINIAEYISETSISKKYLLQDAKENITVQCLINMSTTTFDTTSDVDSSFATSAQPTPQTFELRTVNIERLLPSVGSFKTSEEEIEALFSFQKDLKITKPSTTTLDRSIHY
eukprot:NODE_50_length_31184_cov_0.705099.p21 type:complete len:208 gc:universal NODE_50_length_31184_cov_0.705099:13342-12719(-)